MSDSTVKKVSSKTSPHGDMGQVYLASGKGVSMRLWRSEPADETKPEETRDYETVGYVVEGAGRAALRGADRKARVG